VGKTDKSRGRQSSLEGKCSSNADVRIHALQHHSVFLLSVVAVGDGAGGVGGGEVLLGANPELAEVVFRTCRRDEVSDEGGEGVVVEIRHEDGVAHTTLKAHESRTTIWVTSGGHASEGALVVGVIIAPGQGDHHPMSEPVLESEVSDGWDLTPPPIVEATESGWGMLVEVHPRQDRGRGDATSCYQRSSSKSRTPHSATSETEKRETN
jgi:hypothetical protein